jgi:LemA protein
MIRVEPSKYELVWIRGGVFEMGSVELDDEKPVHDVTVPDFYMGRYPVEVLTAVTMARIQAGKVMEKISQEGLNQENIESLDTSQAQVSTAFRSFFAMVENYPDLKASSNFLTLQDQFEGTENRISVARQRYNTAVRTYNSKLDKFPGIIIAPVFGFEQAGFFQAQPEAFTPIKAAF